MSTSAIAWPRVCGWRSRSIPTSPRRTWTIVRSISPGFRSRFQVDASSFLRAPARISSGRQRGEPFLFAPHRTGRGRTDPCLVRCASGRSGRRLRSRRVAGEDREEPARSRIVYGCPHQARAVRTVVHRSDLYSPGDRRERGSGGARSTHVRHRPGPVHVHIPGRQEPRVGGVVPVAHDAWERQHLERRGIDPPAVSG